MAASARCLLVVLIVAAVVLVAAPAAAAAPRPAGPPSPPPGPGSPAPAPTPVVRYRPPVDAPVREPYRAPIGPYAPGQRGIEYDTAPGVAVAASADGVVAFAGVVAGDQWVTLRHADGLRTTVGPLATIAVVPGAVVAAGELLGTTSGPLLFTVRRGDEYLDPATVLSTDETGVHLVPTIDPKDMLAAELQRWRGRSLLDQVGRVIGTIEHLPIGAFALPRITASVADGVAAWWVQQQACTAELSPVPPAVAAGHVAVLVGGLGSSSQAASIDDLDLGSLGIADANTIRFSYRGGRTPGHGESGPLASVPATPYTATDTLGDLRVAGRELAETIGAVAARTPVTTPIDVFAHSQGGIVLRLALADLERDDPATLARVANAVTLATPHQGAPLAGDAALLDSVPGADAALDAVSDATGLGIDAGSVAVAELAPASMLMDELADTPVPANVRFVSIAARGDVVVPAPRAWLAGATNVVVSVGGSLDVDDHGALPGSAAARREVALALAGAPPSCQSLVDVVSDHVVGTVVDTLEDGTFG